MIIAKYYMFFYFWSTISLKVIFENQAVMAHAFNPITRETEANGSL